jgi:hypothetical protein
MSANLINDGFGFVGVAAVVDDDAGAGGAERKRGGSAHAAGGAGDQSGLVGKHCHGFGPDPGRCAMHRLRA